MAASQNESDIFSRWGEMQQKTLEQWVEASKKMYQPWMDSVSGTRERGTPFPDVTDFLSKWSEMMRENLERASGSAYSDDGPKVLFRMMGAGNVLVLLQEFWAELYKDLPMLYQVKDDDEESRKIFDRWATSYTKVFEKLFGTVPSTDSQEMMKSWLNIVQTNQAAFGHIWNPWFNSVPQFQEQIRRFMTGDLTSLTAGGGLWREAYDETLGKVFRMPALGLTKDQSEKVRRTYDTFLQFGMSLPHFYQFFYDASMEALREMFNKVRNLKPGEFSPDKARELYRLWIATNEDAFFELFKKPDFSSAMSEVLHLGLRLKKRIDELNNDWCEAMSIPSNREFDALIKTVHELRRTVRLQQKTIEALQEQVDRAQRRGDAANADSL